MIMLVVLLTLLVAGVVTLVVMAYKTRGGSAQPPDVNPYVNLPGDTDTFRGE